MLLRMIFTKLAHGLSQRISGVTHQQGSLTRQNRYSPTTDVDFRSVRPVVLPIWVYNFLCFSPKAAVNVLATSCKDVVLLIDAD